MGWLWERKTPRKIEILEIFLDVLESPRVMELVVQIVGQDVSAVEFSARTVPPDGEGGYTEWHRDYVRAAARWLTRA